MKFGFFAVAIFLLTHSGFANAKLNIVTTTQDWASLAQSIGKDLVDVNYLVKGTQDAHVIEAKPSELLMLTHADLVIATGLQLEAGWLPMLLRSVQRPTLLPGKTGYLEAAAVVHPIEVADGAAGGPGDSHPIGNPHFSSDPVRILEVADLIARRLGELDPKNSTQYTTNSRTFKRSLKKRISDWQKRMAKFKGAPVIGYHTTFDYFFDRFGLRAAGFLEPRPGIPPTAAHVLSLIDIAKHGQVRLIFAEKTVDPKPAQRLAEQIPGMKIVDVPTNVGGDARSTDYENWIEDLVSSVEKALSS